MELNLEEIKAAALAADKGVWSIGQSCIETGNGIVECTRYPVPKGMPDDHEENTRFIGIAGNPRTVLALVERLERAERISPYAFWVTAVDEFDDLCPAEVLAGACLAQRTEAPTPAQRRTLELSPVERFNRIKAYVARPADGIF